MSVNNAFKNTGYIEKTINIEMNINHARSLWGFIKICLEEQQKQGKFVMSAESAVKVINGWESIAKAIDGSDKVPAKDAYGNVFVNAEFEEIEK